MLLYLSHKKEMGVVFLVRFEAPQESLMSFKITLFFLPLVCFYNLMQNFKLDKLDRIRCWLISFVIIHNLQNILIAQLDRRKD